MLQQKIQKSFGPIALSAISIFICMIIIQPIACWMDPTFSLYANRGVGKIGITLLVITHIFLLLFAAPKKLWTTFITTNFSFFTSPTWIRSFATYFGIFFIAHALFMLGFIPAGAAQINMEALATITPALAGRLAFGFLATFFLAWTEELIFRGTVYPLLAQYLAPLPSALGASFIFMAAHDLHNPLNLVTVHWRLGLGLFLLGLLLNLTFILTKKLYTGMGIHAGLVFVKVVLRRLPLLIFALPHHMPWWLDQDLRQAPLAQAALGIGCLILIAILYQSQQEKNTRRTT